MSVVGIIPSLFISLFYLLAALLIFSFLWIPIVVIIVIVVRKKRKKKAISQDNEVKAEVDKEKTE